MEKSKLNLREVEYKFDASGVNMNKFINLFESKGSSPIFVTSTDIYYTNGVDDNFIRYRNGDNPELTQKRKINSNWNRIEINLPLGEVLEGEVTYFMQLLGFQEKFRIKKDCVIFEFPTYDISHYKVLNPKGEYNDFIEIELKPDHNHKGLILLDDVSQSLKELHKKPLKRLSESLYEIYKD